jgi:copper chaperone CopZ
MSANRPAGLRPRGALFAFLMAGFLIVGARAQGSNTVYAVQANGLACPFCAYGIEKQFRSMKGVDKVETDIASGTVKVTMKSGATMDEQTAKKAVEAAGFTMRGFGTAGAPQ